jgi:hypothetical protein
MAQNSYSQSLDSLPLKELNNEFLKGIKARERVVVLKEIIRVDSLQLGIYKDSIVPNYESVIKKSKEEVTKLNRDLAIKESELKIYRYGFIGMTILAVLGFIF